MRFASFSSKRLFFAFALSIPLCAAAGKVCFGTGEKLHFVTNTELRDPTGAELSISRKFTSRCFLFPYSQSDDGFVLTVQNDRTKYYPFPDAAEIPKLQAAGLLPSPLPTWETGFFQLLFEAYFLWVVVAAIAIVIIYTKLASSRRRVAA